MDIVMGDVKRVNAGPGIGAVATGTAAGRADTAHWIKAAKAGKLNVAVIKVVTPEQMELSRLRAEDIRLQRQCEILKSGGSPNRKRLTDAQRLALIQAIDQELKGAYGSPRMVRELRDRGFPASKERVEPA